MQYVDYYFLIWGLKILFVMDCCQQVNNGVKLRDSYLLTVLLNFFIGDFSWYLL